MSTDLAMSIAVLAVFALFVGAFYLWRKGAGRLQPILMIVAALVLLGNVALISGS